MCGDVLGVAGHGQAEVHDLDDAILGDLDIGRFDIPVDDVHVVGIVQGAAELDAQIGHDIRRRRDEFGQRPAFHIFHHEEVVIIFLGLIVDGHDVGVVKGGGAARFPAEARLSDGADIRQQDFDRDPASKPLISGQVDGGSSALADQLLDNIAAQ